MKNKLTNPTTNTKSSFWGKTKTYQISIISKFPGMTMINGQDTTESPDVLLTNCVNLGGEIIAQTSAFGPQGMCTIWTVKVPVNN